VGTRRHAIWDEHNRKHLFVDHADRGITEAQVTYVVENATDDNIAPRIRGMERRSRFAASDDGSCPSRGSSDHGVVATRCMLTGLAGARGTA
jgi:hypothetical protein